MKKIIFAIVTVMIAIVTQSFYQNTIPTARLQNGQTVYATYCMSCHMENGAGLENAFPTLVKTGNLNDKNRLVKIILQGMRGPITVKGMKYESEMAGVDLTDKEVADVINYIRNSWGNKAPAMQVSEVAVAKKSVVNGYQPY
jgi:mono/diheme cytochrome c family protein